MVAAIGGAVPSVGQLNVLCFVTDSFLPATPA